jgi:hypothetical protein
MGFLRRLLPLFIFVSSFILLTACATIASVAASRGDTTTDPRYVEAWMREEHGTLDALSASEFEREAILGLQCAADSDDATNGALARSHGL